MLNKNGDSLLDYALVEGHEEIAALLISKEVISTFTERLSKLPQEFKDKLLPRNPTTTKPSSLSPKKNKRVSITGDLVSHRKEKKPKRCKKRH